MKVINYIIKPFRKYPVVLLTLSILLYYPEVSWIPLSDGIVQAAKYLVASVIGTLFNNLLITTAVVYIGLSIVYILGRLNKHVGTIALGVLHIIVFIVVFSNEFLERFFGTRINAMVIKLLFETNPSEANDFITSYIINKDFLIIVFQIISVVLFELGLLSLYRKMKFKKPIWIKIPVVAYCLLSVVYFLYLQPVFSHDWRQNYIFIEENRLPLCSPNTEYSYVWSVNLAVVQYIYEREEKEISVKSQSKAGNASIEPGNIANIVLIIGESSNRHHCSTYGYPIQTNAYTESIPDVCAFSDVITSINVTANTFQNMFSVASANDTTKWCDVPFFPAIFKKAGFNVVFWSNQFISELNMSNGDFSGDFFSHPELREKCFSFYNTEKRNYDGEFLDYYKEKRDSIEVENNNLVIFHLAGQHVDPVSHFPENRTMFTTKDYNYRKELSDVEKQQVANYDNCTLYVDSVVAEIIGMYKELDAVILYVPDHGDEANDYQSHIGRSYDLEGLGAPCLHCQFDIPFLMYMTPTCRQNHPEKYEQMQQAKDRRFMTDDMPHLLFYLAGIKTKWYRPKLCLFSPNYDMKKHRIISNNIDYDKVCSDYGDWRIGYKK